MGRSFLLAIGWLSLFVTASAEAQFVRVGPLGGVSIRGPRGSVDVLPFGLGTRVQSPGASLSTGLFGFTAPPRYAYGYGNVPLAVVYRPQLRYEAVPVYPVIAVPVVVAPVFVQPAIAPTVYWDTVVATPITIVEAPPMTDPVLGAYDVVNEPAIMTTGYSQPDLTFTPVSTREKLRAAAVRLRDSLSMRHLDADIWLNYLKPDKIIVALDDHEPADELVELLRNYDGLAGNSDLNHIWSLDGFWQTHSALRTWLESDEPKVDAVSEPATPSPKTESPKTESPKTESPKTESPKTESPKSELTKSESTKSESTKSESTKPDLGDSVLEPKAEEVPQGEAEPLPEPKIDANR